MKRIKLFLVFLLVMSIIFPVSASTNGYNEQAKGIAVNYMIASGWNYSITKEEPIYNDDFEQIGYVYELGQNSSNGYIIVTVDENKYSFAEASDECESPFYGNDNLYNIYSGALEYRFDKPKSLLKQLKLNFFVKSPLNNSASVMAAPAKPYKTTLVTEYLEHFDSSFEDAYQGSVGKCVPYSFAMALRYMENEGMHTINSDYQNMDKLGNKLYELMKDGNSETHQVKDSTAVAGFNTFQKNYIDKNEYATYYYYSKFSFYDLQKQIDKNYPVVICFWKPALSKDYDHTATAVGYEKLVEYYKDSKSQSGYITKDATQIVIVKDPGTRGTPEKRVAWKDSNVMVIWTITISKR